MKELIVMLNWGQSVKGGVMSKSIFRFSIHLVELTLGFPKMCPILKSGV